MFRFGMAGLLFIVLVSHVDADYFLIKVDVNQVKFASLGKGGAPDIGPVDDVGPRWVIGAFEYNRAKPPVPLPDATNPKVLGFDHRWGKNAYLKYPPYPNVALKSLKFSVTEQFKDNRKKAFTGAKNPDDFLRLAFWALQHGLTKEFHMAMDDLRKVAPARLALKSYDQLTAAMKKQPGGEDPLQGPFLKELRDQGFSPSVSEDGHFAIYAKSGVDSEASLKRRKTRLEESFSNYFYWFALQEKMPVPSLPAYRLVVIVDMPNDFLKRRKEAGSSQLQGDAFTMRRENILVLSAKCTAEDYVFLENNLQPVRNNLAIVPNAFLSGDVWKNPDAQKNLDTVAAVQILTLLQKSVEDDSELAAISREVTRQLLGATGLLANNVTAPEWFLTGVTSFFETPTGSLHPNFGLPSTSNLLAFKRLRKTGKFGKPGDVLLNLATDSYFRQARADQARVQEAERREVSKKERDRLQTIARESQEMAQSTSWALVYFLSLRHEIPYLRHYAQQLNDLPRHMELSPQTLQTCFARAFKLEDARDRKLDMPKLQALADAWFQEMERAALENTELETFIRDEMPGTKK